MIEVGPDRHSLAHHIIGREVDAQGLSAACGLCGAHINLANQGRVVTVLQVKLERQVVAHTLLLVLDLEHRVEISNLVTGTNHKRLRQRLD